MNSCQQTAKKSENGKTGPPTNPATELPQKFFLLLQYNLFSGVDEMREQFITVTVSVRVSVTVRVSLVLSVSTNSFGASSVAICRCCVYKTLLQLIAETAIRSTVRHIVVSAISCRTVLRITSDFLFLPARS